MGFWQSIGAFYRGYFNFETRSSRSEYWWPKLFKTLVYLSVFMMMSVMAGGTGTGPGDIIVGIAVIIMILFYVANIIPNIAVAVRRFHDQDQSGWMFLLSLIPYVGGMIVMVFMCIGGTNGDNKFGTDPLGDNMFDTFS